MLTPQAIDQLFETLRELADGGVSIVFISHKLHEVRSLATRCVVMRAGKVVAEVDPRTESDASSRAIDARNRPAASSRRMNRRLDKWRSRSAISTCRGWINANDLNDVSFDVRSGEIVGVAGISGNGQQTLMAALAGELLVEPDAIWLFDQPVGRLDPSQRRALGFALCS